MTLRHLAISNIKGNWHRYLAFFLSCTFSVFVFYLFLSFILHPAFTHGRYIGGTKEAVQRGMLAAEVVILIFSFIFILYSTGAFLRSRKYEFGLLTLLGMTQRQQRRMVWLEFMVISFLSIVVGLISGILFSKLFFMAMSVLLAVTNPIYFYVPPVAVLITAIVFLGVFSVLTMLSVLQLRQSSVRELLVAKRQAKALPRWRPLAFLLGLILVGWGYTKAWHTYGNNLVDNMFPILGLVIAGTYLAVSQGGVAVCRWFQKRGASYSRGTNMITLNRLTFRLKENARIIFTSAILIAVVCTALGTLNTVLQGARAMALAEYGFAITLRARDNEEPIDPNQLVLVGDQVALAVEEDTGEPIDWLLVSGPGGHLTFPQGGELFVVVISEANYRAAAEIAPHLPPVKLEEQSASLFHWTRDGEDKPLGAASVRLGDAAYDLKQVAYFNQDVCSMSVLVVPDVNYWRWVGDDDSLQFWHQLCFETPNWHKLLNVHE
ncbi:MAG: ABC transporter permease, partial [Firmicutes bacterium]|nr:ABC transporter permease [Bacillota bacterium]